MISPSTTTSPLTGIHHVTAFAKHPAENHDFYTRVLGQRLVKRTVNFDDPLTYHLYFGDHAGSPGTLLTHFPHPHAKPGVHGSPELLRTVMRVPVGALGFWRERLAEAGSRPIEHEGNEEKRLEFQDPHGMLFALVERDTEPGARGYAGAGIDPAHALLGIERMEARVPDIAETAGFLTDRLGFAVEAETPGRMRLSLGRGMGDGIELIESPRDPRTAMGAGTVHHVAWRVPDEATQADVAVRVREHRVAVTPVLDRQYFRSIYFKVPGGIVFEVATDGPGFDADEPLESLGAALKLPPQYEARREEIEAHLVPLGAARA